MIDSGAGPCVIDLAVLKEWNHFNKIKLGEGGRNLYGLGISKIILLKVQLHQNLVKNQEFKVVEGLGRTIILGRTFLSGFQTLKINWDTLQVDIGNVWGSDVIKRGELGSRVMVAQGDLITENQPKIANYFSMKHRDDLTEGQQKKFQNLLVEYSDIFVDNPKKPPETPLVSHVINTGNTQPVQSKLRHFPPQWAQEMDTQSKEMMKNGICRPSKSTCSIQVLWVWVFLQGFNIFTCLDLTVSILEHSS